MDIFTFSVIFRVVDHFRFNIPLYILWIKQYQQYSGIW